MGRPCTTNEVTMTTTRIGKTSAKIIGAAFAMALVSMLAVGSFAGALHRPVPHGLPVAVVGPSGAVGHVEAALAVHAPGAFSLRRYGDEAAARGAVLDRSVDAALYLGPGGPQLLVAGATGEFTTSAVTSAFQAVASASGQSLAVLDIRPAPSGDPYGISEFCLVVGLAIPAIGFGIALSVLAGRRLKPAAWLGALGVFAVLVGLVATWTADGVVGALVGAPFALFGLDTLAAFAMSAACAAAARFVGLPLAGLMALLFFPVGIPAAGGPFGTTFVTSWYGDLGSALPAGATMSAVRNIVYFNGNGLGGPLLVLGLWAALAGVVLFLPPVRLAAVRRRSRVDLAAPLP